MKKYIGIIGAVLVLFLSLVLLFGITSNINATVIITGIFILIAYIGCMVFIFNTWKEIVDTEEQFLYLPCMIVAGVYMALQIPVGIVFALFSAVMSWKATLLINLIIMIVAWLFILGAVAGKDHIQKVDSRQKDHHTVF